MEDYPFPGGWHLIPPHMHSGIYEYVMNGIPPGDFLKSIIVDAPISECFARADDVNQHMMLGWVRFMHNYVPMTARRSGYATWIASGGINGQRKADAAD